MNLTGLVQVLVPTPNLFGVPHKIRAWPLWEDLTDVFYSADSEIGTENGC
jgi:hypothetical protein